MMTEKTTISDAVAYASGSIVSKSIIKKDAGNISLFAFDKGQIISEHTAPFDAFVQVIEGTGVLILEGKRITMHQGDCIVMPANSKHALEAEEKFKMMLVMIKSKE